jgi:hypothetical protein
MEEVMENEMLELAQRAVACKHWRWMEGMAFLKDGHRYRIVYISDDGHSVGAENNRGDCFHGRIDKFLPDLNDPATLGCLLALVREVWGDRLLHVEPYHSGEWHVWPAPGLEVDRDTTIWHGETEAAALVAALEVAP